MIEVKVNGRKIQFSDPAALLNWAERVAPQSKVAFYHNQETVSCLRNIFWAFNQTGTEAERNANALGRTLQNTQCTFVFEVINSEKCLEQVESTIPFI